MRSLCTDRDLLDIQGSGQSSLGLKELPYVDRTGPIT
jgi:hypothetical protein